MQTYTITNPHPHCRISAIHFIQLPDQPPRYEVSLISTVDWRGKSGASLVAMVGRAVALTLEEAIDLAYSRLQFACQKLDEHLVAQSAINKARGSHGYSKQGAINIPDIEIDLSKIVIDL